jgi:hypothetical protein
LTKRGIDVRIRSAKKCRPSGNIGQGATAFMARAASRAMCFLEVVEPLETCETQDYLQIGHSYLQLDHPEAHREANKDGGTALVPPRFECVGIRRFVAAFPIKSRIRASGSSL